MTANRKLLDKALAGERLSPEDGLALLESRDLAALAWAADAVCRRLHPAPYRTYNIDRNINYTNVCIAGCRFCAFYRKDGAEDAYVLSIEEVLDKVRETVELGGNQILLQGGLHPQLKLDWYERLIGDVKRQFPRVNVHAFSPPEIQHFTRLSGLPVRGVLERLQQSGLGSIPGGGAEILVDRVRREVSPGKGTADDWLEVMRTWHELGGRSTATMMFGHVETPAERIEHLERLRELQDATGGFTAFICWTFQRENTQLADLKPAGAFSYLKMLAVARLYLDNFPNLQASWVTQGIAIGQLAMQFGANDMGSLMLEENVVAEAGTAHDATLGQIRDAIAELGFVPRQRNVYYELVAEEHELAAVEANENRNTD